MAVDLLGYETHHRENSAAAVKFFVEEYEKDSKKFSEWLNVGDKGIPFAFFNEEKLWFPAKKKVSIFGRMEEIQKKTYPILYITAFSDRRGSGLVDIPLHVFRTSPYLPEEIEILSENNLAAPLIQKMPDLKRALMLIDIVGTTPFYAVRFNGLHRNGWDSTNNKIIYDRADMEESKRIPLGNCYKFVKKL